MRTHLNIFITKSAPYQDDGVIHSAIEKINAAHLSTDEQVKASSWQIEDSKQTCYLSFDDIGVKHQKERRKGNGEKNSIYVWNTVADIETNQGCYTVTGVGMKKTFHGMSRSYSGSGALAQITALMIS